MTTDDNWWQLVIQQAKFAFSSLEKAFGKQTKTIEDQGEFNNLSYYYTTKNDLKYFVRFRGPISFQKEEKIQEEFTLGLDEIKS